MDGNEAEGPSSASGLEGMGLIVLVCYCGKGRGEARPLQRPFDDLTDLFAIACIKSRGRVSFRF